MFGLFEAIRAHPGATAWLFLLANAAWVLFVYFNKQRHDRAMAQLTSDLNLESERRTKVFEVKLNLYESYVSELDSFNQRNQVDLPARMQPLFDKYIKDYLGATECNNKEKERETIAWFTHKVQLLLQHGIKEFMKLQAQSNRLKLTATDEMIITFSELETLTRASMDKVNEFMSEFVTLTLNNDETRIGAYNAQLWQLSIQTQQKSSQLMSQMRAELQSI